jgi:hypothetical protein
MIRLEMRGAAALVAAPLALLLAGCGGQRTPIVLAPATTATPTTVWTRPTLAPRTTVTTVAPMRAAAAAAVPAPSAAPVPAASAATSVAARGISVKVPATSSRTSARPAAPVSAPKAPATPPTSRPTSAPSTVATTTTAPPALQMMAPSARALPDGPFEVMVAGATAFVLEAAPAAVCTVERGRVVPLAAGDCTVRATADGRSPASATVRLDRADPTITWPFAATTPFTYNTVPLELRSSSGAPARATAASGACRLVTPSTLSFVPASGAPKLGTCSVTVAVDATPLWNAATATLVTSTSYAPVTVLFDAPATSASATLSVRAVMTQPDRSLDTRLSFAVQTGGGCALAGATAVPDAATRAATLKLTGSVPATHWCVLKLVARGGDALAVTALTGLGCAWVWLGSGTPSGTRPACPK